MDNESWVSVMMLMACSSAMGSERWLYGLELILALDIIIWSVTEDEILIDDLG